MDYKLTSVKLLKELYKKFKSKTLDDEFTLQKLVNRSMDLYVLDEQFKDGNVMKEMEKEISKMADYSSKLEMLDYFEAEIGPNKTVLKG